MSERGSLLDPYLIHHEDGRSGDTQLVADILAELGWQLCDETSWEQDAWCAYHPLTGISFRAALPEEALRLVLAWYRERDL